MNPLARVSVECAAFAFLVVACSSDALPSAGGSAGAAAVANAGQGTGGSSAFAGSSNGGGAAATTQSGGNGGAAIAGGAAGLSGVSGNGGNAGSGLAGTGATMTVFPPLITGCDIPSAQAHADSALGSSLSNFWSGADQYMRATSPSNGKITGYWTYAQMFDAVLDGVERTHGQHYRGLVRAFYEGRAARGWTVDFYDDEAWMTLALMRAFDLTGDPRYIDTAETIYKDIMLGWDTSCCGTHLGGIWWDKKKTSKATASNAGPALAGVRLAKRTNKPEYLDFAKKVYAFWMSDMVDQKTFAIYDHFSTDGTRGAGALTYNHGLMIGAALELHAATAEAHYLTEAHAFGHYTITTATRSSSAGPLLYDGSPCTGDCAAWKGIGYRYLAALYRQDPTHVDYRNVLTSGANALWALARSPATSLFGSVWAGPPPSTFGVEAQGSAAMALNQYAMLCGSDLTAAPPKLGVYQAEEGWLDHVDFEASNGRNFIGLGYVSGWTKDKQGVSIDIEVERAGKYALDWRYTAGEGACKRSLIVNGQAQPDQQVFPATPNWTNWPNARSTVDLPAGKSTVALRFDAAKGSTTSLDVDQLTVTAL